MPQAATPSNADMNNSRQKKAWRELSFVKSLFTWGWSFALTLFGLALVTFALTRLSPIDPALQMVGDISQERSTNNPAERHHGGGEDCAAVAEYIVLLKKPDPPHHIEYGRRRE